MNTKNLNSKMLLIACFAILGVSCSTDTSSSDEPYTPPQGEGTELNGTLNEDRTLDGSKQYTLTGTYSVSAGATLTIPAGTKITANTASGNSTSTYIVVQKGGKINVQGTANNPVVLTSNNETPGDWGGLVIAGDATTTEGTNATAEIGQIAYGGSNDADNSGSIKYLIINYAGAQINAESQFNGLTLYAVGSGTTIENVAVLNGTDDGVEFFGGTVKATNMYFENNEDDAVDWTEGWNGSITNTYILHNKSGFSTALEGDGVNNNPTFTNLTAVSTVDGMALQFKKTSGATLTNVNISGYATNLDMKDNGPLANVIVDGTAMTTAKDDVFNGTLVDVDLFAWATGN